MVPPTALPTPTPEPDVEARLALAEHLLACDEPRLCAQHVVAWLTRERPSDVAACLARDSGTERWVCLAARNLSEAQRDALAFQPGETSHPLAETLT